MRRILIVVVSTISLGGCSSTAGVLPAGPHHPIAAEEKAGCDAYLAELRGAPGGLEIVDGWEHATLGARFQAPKVHGDYHPRASDLRDRPYREARVVMAGVIDLDGRVKSAKVIVTSGHRSFDAASLKAFAGASFQPGALDGRPARTFMCAMTSISKR